MLRLPSLRHVVTAGLLAFGALGLGSATASASDYCPPKCEYKWVTTYETVVCYETRREPYTKVVTQYDHCGKPYEVTTVCYRDVQVAVKKQVPVKKKVLVCYK